MGGGRLKGANSGAKRKYFQSWNDILEWEGVGQRGPIEPVVIFFYPKNVRLEGIDPFSGYLISVLGHIPGQAPGRFSVVSRSGSRPSWASFDLNPTFIPLKTPFRSSCGVVLRCFFKFMDCLALFVD